MNIKEIERPNDALASLVSGFQQELARLNNRDFIYNENAIRNEMNSYFTNGKVVICSYEGEQLLGFAVLKADQGIYWLDWIYVEPVYRGTACASALFDFAEAYAISKGCEKLYIWVNPDNQRMLAFLKKKGYDCLNLIEVTKKGHYKRSASRSVGKSVKILNRVCCRLFRKGIL